MGAVVRLVIDALKLVRKVEERKAAKLPKHEPGEQGKN
jgi:hypothetical protein